MSELKKIEIKKELLYNEIIWYEDGNILEWIDGHIQDREDHHRMDCDLEDAFVIAKNMNATLVIQPEYQDQCIFADFSL